MRVLGVSPLDKDATASVIEDGRVLFAAGEERFSRIKQHAGFPERAIAAGLAHAGWSSGEIDLVAYPFLDAPDEEQLIRAAVEASLRESGGGRGARLAAIARLLDAAEQRASGARGGGHLTVHGLS
ncbi:MAG TPA: carbamoyltransferase N-terminal domain-containing protein, partial [Planctomycetota bacterium]|nr:carbamoyltransferase N-terminal domain-containing protein [Planctomycetota bacterium]